MAGLDEIPAVIMTGDELKVAEVALIENVQRKDLNPIEEAMAYKALIERFASQEKLNGSREPNSHCQPDSSAAVSAITSAAS